MNYSQFIRLTEPQKRALYHLAKFPDQWRGDTPVTQRCLNVLKQKGLVKVTFEPEKGFGEMITPAGLEEIANCETCETRSIPVPPRKLSEPEPILLVRRLQALGLYDKQILAILDIIDSTCPDCQDNDIDCRCWDDS